MTDHYALAEQALAEGKLTASMAHSLLALVEEFRKPEPTYTLPNTPAMQQWVDSQGDGTP